jgi:diphthine-ammonia ligase
MVTTPGQYTRSHRLRWELLLVQSQALAVPLCQRRASWDTQERVFKRAVGSLKRRGVEGGIFGYLALNEHREWVQKICAEAGIVPLLALWGTEGKALLCTFIEAGFEAIGVALRSDIIDDHWLGIKVDGEFVEQRKKRQIDVCGEKGEYYSLVIDGPIFRRRIAIGQIRIARRATVAFLQVLSCALVERT